MSTPVLPRLGRYTITTNQLEEFVNIVCLWIRQSLPGGLIYGRQRAGKSTAVHHFVGTLQIYFQDTVGCIAAEVQPGSLGSAKPFWGGLLKSMKIPVPPSKSAEVRRDWFVGRIVEAAASSVLNKVAVIIDEASLLTESAWLLLLGVDNELRTAYDIDVTWLFVGQPELATVPVMYLGLGRREVVGRFMTDSYEFRDMSDVNDFRRALAGFDVLKDRSDGHPLSENAHPKKYLGGWRFADEAEVILNAVDEARSEHGLEAREGMTVQGFVRLATHLIVETIPDLAIDEPLTQAMVLDAIDATNCLIFERHAEMLAAEPAVSEKGKPYRSSAAREAKAPMN